MPAVTQELGKHRVQALLVFATARVDELGVATSLSALVRHLSVNGFVTADTALIVRCLCWSRVGKASDRHRGGA